MSTRAAELVRLLDLRPHPEGGSYTEVWRSPSDPGARAASTLIYFLLEHPERSRWHQVDADEVWSHLEGQPLELWSWEEGRAPERRMLGPLDPSGARPTLVVPAGCWQAARPIAGYVLCGCTVAPGFDFRGFTLLADRPETARRLRLEAPTLSFLI
jgi:predicted cupin superfamily sugar epimerase